MAEPLTPEEIAELRRLPDGSLTREEVNRILDALDAASAAVAEVDRLREALEPFAAAFTADRMPVTRRSAYEAVAALIAESRGMPQCDYSETGPQIEGAPFAPSTWHCVLRLGHAGPHEFRDVAL